MAQHQRPIGPTGTNTQATFAPNMVSDARPQRPQLGKPQPLGWTSSQTTHVAAAFSVEMIAGSKPERARPPFQAQQGWSVSQITHTAAPFSVDMVAGSKPDRFRERLAPRSIYAFVPPDVLVFSVEMAQGSHPDRPQLAKPFSQGWSVAQLTHVEAAFSPEMTSGVHADLPRRPFTTPVGWFGFFPQITDVPPESIFGWHQDRPQLSKPRPIGWIVSQPTHTSAPVSIEMLAGHHPDRNRATHGMQPQSAVIGPLETVTGPVLVQPRGSRYQWKFHDATIYK